MRLKRILQVKWMVLAAAVWLAGGMNVAQGQEVRASLGGRVTDSQGAAIPNAKVAVISDDTNVEQHTTTNGSGVRLAPTPTPER